MRRGSISVFLALALVLVLSFICSLLEGARVFCMDARAQLETDACLQSLFGNYQKGIWEDYHLLFLDGSWQEGDFSMDRFTAKAMDELRENLSLRQGSTDGWDLTKLSVADFEEPSYELATDDGGDAFVRQVTQLMKLEAVDDAVEELANLRDLEEKKGVADSAQNEKGNTWEDALDALSDANAQKEAQEALESNAPGGTSMPGGSSTPGGSSVPGGSGGPGDAGAPSGTDAPEGSGASGSGGSGESEVENPMEYVKQIKGFSVLALVLGDQTDLSGKALADFHPLEDGVRNQGNWAGGGGFLAGAVDRLSLQRYIPRYFSSYTTDSENGPAERVLDYEVEYLVGGKESDGENLEAVVKDLLGMREALNFTTILQDGEKKNMALGIATAAVGFTGIPILVTAVQMGILLAWSFVESVLDVRTLLAGGKVPLLKRPDQWASDLTDCRSSIEGDVASSDDGDGQSYDDYLQILLLGKSQKAVAYRCMDLIGQNEGVEMDEMLQSVKVAAGYQAEPLFWSFVSVGNQGMSGFHFSKDAEISYGDGKGGVF